jgi:hypothetical protein
MPVRAGQILILRVIAENLSVTSERPDGRLIEDVVGIAERTEIAWA